MKLLTFRRGKLNVQFCQNLAKMLTQIIHRVSGQVIHNFFHDPHLQSSHIVDLID